MRPAYLAELMHSSYYPTSSPTSPAYFRNSAVASRSSAHSACPSKIRSCIGQNFPCSFRSAGHRRTAWAWRTRPAGSLLRSSPECAPHTWRSSCIRHTTLPRVRPRRHTFGTAPLRPAPPPTPPAPRRSGRASARTSLARSDRPASGEQRGRGGHAQPDPFFVARLNAPRILGGAHAFVILPYLESDLAGILSEQRRCVPLLRPLLLPLEDPVVHRPELPLLVQIGRPPANSVVVEDTPSRIRSS